MRHGCVCYLELPATDADVSAAFYVRLFGWTIRARGDGALSFSDASGAFSGSWVRGRAPAREPGSLPYVMVDSIDAALKEASAAGGEAVTRRTPFGSAGEAFATIRDPAGNLLGLYESRRP